MSICLCSIRFEISDQGQKPEHLSFKASQILDGEMADSTPKPEDLSSSDARIHPITEKKLKECQGKRTFREILIETHPFGGLSKEKTGKTDRRGSVGSVYTDTPSIQPLLASTPCSSKEPSPPIAFEARSISREASVGPIDELKRSKDAVPFVSGNPFVEVTQGILHLYKDNHMTSLDPYVPKSEMICILAIPATVSCQDLLQFIAPCRSTMEHIKIIKDGTPNQYMALLKFKCQESANQFYDAFNGTAFNTFETNICHLVYIARVEVQKSSEGASLPLGGCTELPTCPVCLERMDESVDGILTILCNHSFHAACLAQWEDTSCPVCRHAQTPEVATDNLCQSCGSNESLWICLVCGHVGCGRYVAGHAYKHFLETFHCYAMQLGNSRVWDYVGDNFVHRLIASKSDGKMVQFEDSRNSDFFEEKHPSDGSGKIDAIQLEYSYLMTSQLEAQRGHFEEKIGEIEAKFREEKGLLSKKLDESTIATSALKHEVVSLTKDKQHLERKVNQLTTKLSKAQQDLKDEKELNQCLLENQSTYKKRQDSLEKQMKEISQEKDQAINELREQLRDLMFYMDAQLKIGNSEMKDEIVQGQVVIPAPQQPTTTSGKKSTGRKKKV
ncbi:BRCA1-associated protein-like [Artemia franciscana]|uniref:BRCA1-associated protein n=1 Tax=Artemia franciscana TaxID=6661 RepID=A0AA88HWV7_ARTSF|nr:hypothetical protein QYM36_012743 [Artemia franciscana]